ncbi:transposable element Tc1 transposase [Trichonephila clavipes]|nr:transposable element Tc1 transposase [Trichonephila clavipes]
MSRVYQEYVDGGQKTSDRARCKGQLTLAVLGSKRTVQSELHRMGFGSHRPTRVPLLNARHRAARLAWAREQRDWSVEEWKRVARSDKPRFQLRNADSRLRIWRQAHGAMNPACHVGTVQGHGGSIMHLWDVLEQGVKGHHTASTNLTELWRALAIIWQVISVERFQKLVESMSRRVEAVIKTRESPTRY